MDKKMSLMHRVWKSSLNASQKVLLTYLISLADSEGRAWPTTAALSKVMGIKHEKNFKGVTHYLPGLVTVGKKGAQNIYTLNTPAIEGVCEAEVVLKMTERRSNTPATEGVNTPATADSTPATEGTGTPSTEGTDRTSIEQELHRTIDRTETVPDGPVASPKDEQPSFGNREEHSLNYRELLESMELDKEEKEWMRRWRKDRVTDEAIYLLLVEMREDAW